MENFSFDSILAFFNQIVEFIMGILERVGVVAPKADEDASELK